MSGIIEDFRSEKSSKWPTTNSGFKSAARARAKL